MPFALFVAPVLAFSRAARIEVAEAGWGLMLMNAQAGGAIVAIRRAARSPTRARRNRCAAWPASALKE